MTRRFKMIDRGMSFSNDWGLDLVTKDFVNK